MPIFGQSDEELAKQKVELNDKAKSLDEKESELTTLRRRYDLDRMELDDAIADFDKRSEHLNRQLEEIRIHHGAEEDRRQKYASQRQAHQQQMAKLEADYRELCETRKRELDESSQKWEQSQTHQEKWAEQLHEQQRSVESGLDRRSAALETAWRERMTELEQKQEKIEKLKADLAKREDVVRGQAVEADNGFQQRRATVERELHELKQRAIQELEASLLDRRKLIAQKEEDLQKQIEANQVKNSELNARENALKLGRQNLTSTIEEMAKEKSEELVVEANNGRARSENRSQRLENALAEREERVRRLEETEFRVNGRSASVILDEMDRQRGEISRLANERDERPTRMQYDELMSRIAEMDTLQGKVRSLQQREAELQLMVNRSDNVAVEFALKEERLRHLQREVEIKAKYIDNLQADLDRLIGMRRDAEADKEKCQQAIQKPLLARMDAIESGAAKDESEWLASILQSCSASGFVFPERLVKSFHTALKINDWSPLTVLAGVSGTGKTQLPNLYARFGGLNFLSEAVQPNWDSPSSLLGYFNAIDNRFDATPLLRALDQASRSPEDESGLNDRLLLILLDEMNLAHVELYLSDFLSYWELKRGDDSDRAINLSLGANVEDPYRLHVGSNVLWCGTMNQDETTKSLSDKVIDRGGVLFFPRPRTLARRERLDLAARGPALSLSQWESWHWQVSRMSVEAKHLVANLRNVVEDINNKLEIAGRAVGHRVWQTIEAYIANHPDVIKAEVADNASERNAAIRTAFGDQIVMKVMPKLRGIETDGNMGKHCLQPIKSVLIEQSLDLERDFDIACKSGHGVFTWSSARYLVTDEGHEQR